VLILLCAGLWLLAGAVALTARWGEIDAQHPFGATTGLALLVIATAGGILLWWRARRADRRGRQSGVGRLTGELADERDAAEVLAVMDAWWRVAGAAALASDGPRVRRFGRKHVLQAHDLGALRLKLFPCLFEAGQDPAAGEEHDAHVEVDKNDDQQYRRYYVYKIVQLGRLIGRFLDSFLLDPELFRQQINFYHSLTP
ncbi:MAG TPA: hypothetical protein PLJ26_07395, partial [Candidatus Omnitrophota bacterium]|nr:hypothetical protein [Candidatus Omnitrophota bacterium]